MKIAIIGPGALGLFFAARLQTVGQEVWLLDHRPERAAQLQHQGLELLTLAGQRQHYPLQAAQAPSAIGPCDLILVLVKAHQTQAAVRQLPCLFKPEGMALTLQNGIGNLEAMAAVVGPERLVAGVTTLGVTRLDTGRIRHAGQGPVVLGLPPDSEVTSEELAPLVAIFRQAGLECRAASEIMTVIWDKLLVNVGINPMTALTRLPNGRLPTLPGAWRVATAAIQEAYAVAVALKLNPTPDPVARVRQVCQATAANRSSMLQDVLNRRRTEIDAINGQIVGQGHALDIPTPVNALLTDLIKALEDSFTSAAAAPETGK